MFRLPRKNQLRARVTSDLSAYSLIDTKDAFCSCSRHEKHAD